MADFTGIPACIAKIYSQRKWPFVYSGSTWEVKKEIIHVTIRMVKNRFIAVFTLLRM